jgi:hypothetical protein
LFTAFNSSLQPLTRAAFILGEWYEDEAGEVSLCSGFEDPICSAQWYYCSVADHMQYLSLPIGCLSVSDGAYSSVLPAEPEEIMRREPEADKVPKDFIQALRSQRAHDHQRQRSDIPLPDPTFPPAARFTKQQLI